MWSNIVWSNTMCCVGSSLCDGLLTRSEESFRECVCICVCVVCFMCVCVCVV